MKSDKTNKIDQINSMLEVDYKESKEDIWAALESELNEPTKVVSIKSRSYTQFISIAAAIVVLLGLVHFFDCIPNHLKPLVE